METKTFKLELPVSNGTGAIEIESGQSIVIVGANGSGKTRLGTWIEFQSQHKNETHRISAQKSLTMPESVRSSDSELAQEEFLFGHANPIRNYGTLENARQVGRWEQKPNTFLLNDFEKLMIVLFSEEASVSIAHRQAQKNSVALLPVPETRLDIVKTYGSLYCLTANSLLAGRKSRHNLEILNCHLTTDRK